jgi:hypothetical protein
MEINLQKLYGGARLKRMQVDLTPEHMRALGETMVRLLSQESKKDFAKRGWSGEAYDGSPAIWESFSYEVKGRTLVISSTYPHLNMLVEGVPEHDMPWLTQEAKKKNPLRYPLTEGERRRGMRQTGTRMPLVVPLRTAGGTVVFRAAPLKLQDAWVHPGIARFTFVERAQRKLGEAAKRVFLQAAMEHLAK